MSIQIAYSAGSPTNDEITLVLNVIDDTGAHVAPDPAVTVPAVYNSGGTTTGWVASITSPATGVVQIRFTGLTLAEGEVYTVMVAGGIGGSAWTPYGVAVLIQATERGTDSVDTTSLATQAELDKVIKSGEAATYASDLGSKSVTVTRD